MPFLQYADLPEVGARCITVRVHADHVETFGFLLGPELNSIGNGHRESVGLGDKGDDHWLAAEYPDGTVAVVVVPDVRPAWGISRVTLHILSQTDDVSVEERLDDLVDRVRRAETAAGETDLRAYAWAAVLGPAGEWANINERARHQFGGSYSWQGLELAPLVQPHEGQARSGWLYREHRVQACGAVQATTSELAQRLADEAAIRAALFLSLLLRTAIEMRQPATHIVEGRMDDLDRLFPIEVLSAPGPYASIEDARAQDYGASRGWHDPPHQYKIAADASELWRTAMSLSGRDADSVWAALAAYRTAWQLRREHPSFGFVALVTAVEALVDERSLPRCPECNALRGVGAAFRRVIADHTGVPEQSLKPITNVVYRLRSKTVHTGALHGSEMLSAVGRRGAWAHDPAAEFERSEWDRLEALVAVTLATWLRRRI
jgi:hypothetical protein